MFSRSLFQLRLFPMVSVAALYALPLVIALAPMNADTSGGAARARQLSFENRVAARSAIRGETAYISDIDRFLEQCPTNDPAINTILSDFQIRRNGVLVRNFQCSEPISGLPISQYTDELITLQGLRTIYYMDRGQSGHLPWTSGTLYDWMKSKNIGVNISDTTGGSFCCETYDGRRHIVVKAQDEFNRDFDREWRGIAGNIGLYAHETRHVDGFFHDSCCGISLGCDRTFDTNNLSAYGTQWWLEKSWLRGDIYVGFACLAPARVREISNWHLNSTDGFRMRFCDTLPPKLEPPENPGGVCRTNAASISAASFKGEELAADSIVAVFGGELATQTQAAPVLPLPTMLAGTTVRVRDSAGVEHLAPLFFVSPAQVNYLMPERAAAGRATVTISTGNGKVSLGLSQLAAVAPGLFAANANGQGVPAAIAVRVTGDGTQSSEPVAQFDAASGGFVPLPIDLGPETDQVFLILFGSGIRRVSSQAAASVSI